LPLALLRHFERGFDGGLSIRRKMAGGALWSLHSRSPPVSRRSCGGGAFRCLGDFVETSEGRAHQQSDQHGRDPRISPPTRRQSDGVDGGGSYGGPRHFFDNVRDVIGAGREGKRGDPRVSAADGRAFRATGSIDRGLQSDGAACAGDKEEKCESFCRSFCV